MEVGSRFRASKGHRPARRKAAGGKAKWCFPPGPPLHLFVRGTRLHSGRLWLRRLFLNYRSKRKKPPQNRRIVSFELSLQPRISAFPLKMVGYLIVRSIHCGRFFTLPTSDSPGSSPPPPGGWLHRAAAHRASCRCGRWRTHRHSCQCQNRSSCGQWPCPRRPTRTHR